MSSPNKQPQVIIDLNKILNLNDLTEVKRMETEFELNDWCFVLLLTEPILDTNLAQELWLFFKSDHRKSRYSQRKGIYGYSKVNHKEGIKILTGNYFGEFSNKGLVPMALMKPLNYLSQVLDAVTKRLIEILNQYSVFQREPSLSSLIERADLPLKDDHFGMLDINEQSTEEVNCVPHYDPGLLSISILSTHEGLQLKNMTNNEWIDEPLQHNIGVIWLGEAASRTTQNRLKSGIHRVIYPQDPTCRVAVWYEICTTEQLRNISADSHDEPMTEGIITLKNLP
ncbi:unnamed protein product [Rotaria magnacalcarata]|uniref:Isopenicillin N synthase-like Fe(2+) 2OG dioxygenase domain-containing protein n=2 Tax=Rotaria magnacalcarata TaxID=392030 RepID=A0A816T5M7_9BILA|nr:unnamed protein product [Rotaria magnacalcarata]CAF2125663.1 unnamed protein product [Rotaria magnacalcarata]CAF3945157.1 unnamed protein product [Rotaria magnacalcarata]CAF3961514.1 unnamed protein product [Rotaria magnacalcarata]CAF4005249.1 unnamed protein product [Rotaria magnacalcarata]